MKKMMLIMVMLAAVCFAQNKALECRTWTMKSGTTVEGTLNKCYTDAKNGKECIMLVMKETGKKQGFTVKQLSDADKAYLDQQVAAGLVPKE